MQIWLLEEAENGGSNGSGNFIISTETGLKQYYIIDEDYTDEHLGRGKVIAPIEGTSGKDRFYVMGLEDINSGTGYCWYYSASIGYLDNIVDYSTNDFGEGEKNTEYVMNKWINSSWGPQDDGMPYLDMCGSNRK